MAKITFAQAVKKAKQPESGVTILSFDQNEMEDRISFRHLPSIIKDVKNQYKTVELKNFKLPLNKPQIEVIVDSLNNGIDNFSMTDTTEDKQTILNVNKNSRYYSINFTTINNSNGNAFQKIINKPLNEKIHEAINSIMTTSRDTKTINLYIDIPQNQKCIIDPNSHLFILDDKKYNMYTSKQSCLILVNIEHENVKEIESSVRISLKWDTIRAYPKTTEYIKDYLEKSNNSHIQIKNPSLELITKLYDAKINSNVKNIKFKLNKSNILVQTIDGITCNDLFKKWFEQGIKTYMYINDSSMKNVLKLNQYSFVKSIDIHTVANENIDKNIFEDLESNVNLKYLQITNDSNVLGDLNYGLDALYSAYTSRNKVIHKLLPSLLDCDFTKVDLSKPFALDIFRFVTKFSCHFDNHFNNIKSNQHAQYINLKQFIFDNYFTIKNGIKGVAIDQKTNKLSQIVKNQIVEYISEPLSFEALYKNDIFSGKYKNSAFFNKYQKTLSYLSDELYQFDLSQIYEQIEMIGASSPEIDLNSI